MNESNPTPRPLASRILARHIPAAPPIPVSPAAIVAAPELVSEFRRLLAARGVSDPAARPQIEARLRSLIAEVASIDAGLVCELVAERDDPFAGDPDRWPAWSDADRWDLISESAPATLTGPRTQTTPAA